MEVAADGEASPLTDDVVEARSSLPEEGFWEEDYWNTQGEELTDQVNRYARHVDELGEAIGRWKEKYA